MNKYENGLMTESEAANAFKTLRLKIILSKIALIAGFIGIPVSFSINFIWLAIVMIIVFIGGASLCTAYNMQIKELSGNVILKKIFYDIFDEVSFDHNGCFGDAEIEQAMFAYPYHTVKGTDLVHGRYKGKEISLCDLQLVRTSHSGKSSHDATSFHGLWVIYDLGKYFGTNVSIREMNSLEKMMSDKGIRTGNEKFDKKFSVITDDSADGKKNLSDRLMNLILDFDAAAEAKSNIAFLRDGKVHIALNLDKDPFAVTASDPEVLKSRFTEKIRVITDFIDILSE